jgi:hypothetical protein
MSSYPSINENQPKIQKTKILGGWGVGGKEKKERDILGQQQQRNTTKETSPLEH